MQHGSWTTRVFEDACICSLLQMELMLRTLQKEQWKGMDESQGQSEELRSIGKKGGSEVWTLAPHTTGYRTHAPCDRTPALMSLHFLSPTYQDYALLTSPDLTEITSHPVSGTQGPPIARGKQPGPEETTQRGRKTGRGMGPAV